jgi:hypothetical protein
VTTADLRLVAQQVPDRQQATGREVEALGVRLGGQIIGLDLPGLLESLALAIVPMAFASSSAVIRPPAMQREAGDRRAIIHQAGPLGISSATREDRPLRSSRVLGPMRFTISASGVNLGAHCASRVKLGRSAIGILAQDPLLDDGQLVGHQRLDAGVEVPALRAHRSVPRPAQGIHRRPRSGAR